MARTILFVPGLWEGPLVFEPVCTLLRSGGFPTETASLASTGKTSPGNPTMDDDIAAVRTHLSPLVEAGKEVVLVCHSAGGIIGPGAMEGLAVRRRREAGLKGGVVAVVFLTAAMAPEGTEHQPMPFFDVKGGAMYCVNARQTLLSDLSDAEVEKWAPVLQCQPAAGWDSTIKYCGWREVPCVYLVCEGDKLLPTALQEHMAHTAGARVERCTAGHMCMLTATEKVVELITDAAQQE